VADPGPRLAIVEPWLGESHAALFEGIARHSHHPCDIVGLPATRWRWRMRIGAWPLAEKLAALDPWPDALLVSDYVNLPALLGLCPRAVELPAAVYFLENQLTYPRRPGRPPDFEFAAINLLTCLAATRCVFCSTNQLEAFLEALPAFLGRDLEAAQRVEPTITAIAEKAAVIPIGVALERFDRAREVRPDRAGQPLRLVWPHRFEHDKNPDDFFAVLSELANEGLPFEVAAVGRVYRDVPPSMLRARKKLGDRIVAWGFLDGDDYAGMLAASDVVVSTAWQETQGIAVIEAIRAGCDPLLPDRLSYPEVLGPALCEKHLYASKGDLRRRLRWMMRHPERLRARSDHWQEMERFGWPAVAPQFDALVAEMIGDRPAPRPTL
jgi:glycosyltransferase involved in cell wall biosynthesis